jgi:hypothetical protein
MRFYFIMILAALAAGCASGPGALPSASPNPPAPAVNLAGYPPAFRAGYADGCASVDGAKKRDETRFKSDATYAQGWQDGNDICRRRK